MGANSWRHRRRLGICLLASLLLISSPPATTTFAQLAELGPPEVPGRPRPLPRVGQMLEWLHREQQLDGGWWWRGRLSIASHAHARQGPDQTQESTALDTAMAGMAMARAGNAPTKGDYSADVRKAADFLYKRVMASGSGPAVDASPTPLGARIGPHADTFFALLFFLEIAGPDPGSSRYRGAVEVLVQKIERNQKPDGSWGHVWDSTLGHEGAGHSPMLGHAAGVWALELAVRQGVKVERGVVELAEKYAMSEAAERHEWKTNTTWKKFRRLLDEEGREPPAWCMPEWLDRSGPEDDDPVNHELYLMAGRLAVLHQAYKTSQWLVRQEVVKLGGRSKADDIRRLRATRGAAERGRAVLEQGRQAAREGWIKIHKNDQDPSPAPLFVSGEDFLAGMMTVDAMAAGEGVQEWFLPMARRLTYFQYYDGGVLTDMHVRCHPECEKRRGFHDSPYTCEWQLSWCSRDRVFLTAAALYMLAAETPYRDAVLGLDNTKSIDALTASLPAPEEGERKTPAPRRGSRPRAPR